MRVACPTQRACPHEVCPGRTRCACSTCACPECSRRELLSSAAEEFNDGRRTKTHEAQGRDGQEVLVPRLQS
jgi:hypothetical protein